MTEATGTRQEVDALRGAGLLQSPAEWDARNTQLASSINSFIARYANFATGRALDVGCMQGELTDRYGKGLPLVWCGIDPDLVESRFSENGAFLTQGFAHNLEFPDSYFDCITFANVYEHLPPQLREASMADFYRVLAPGGVLVGQIPNPYFPIESHSRLPFLGYLPRRAQRLYWRLTPTGWDFEKAHFFSVTTVNLRKTATKVGFKEILTCNFNYSPEAIPASVRWAAVLHAKIGLLPWAWQFIYRKPK